MTHEEWERLHPLYLELSELPPGARQERLAGIEAVRPGDAEILRRMLRVEGESGFLASPSPATDIPPTAARATAPMPGAPPAPAHGDDAVAGQSFDEFVVVRRLGAGGMGVVYLADDTILHRRVALKVLPGHLADSPEAIARFQTEAQSAAVLKHPGIVPVFKFGRAAGTCYIASEYVEGPTLAAMIAAESRRREDGDRTSDVRLWHRLAAGIVGDVADALECSHRAGIIHRDVKPSNIIVEHARRPRLTDFGIAKHVADAARTSAGGSGVGSCHYMSPEQAAVSAARIDERSDIFSLGVVLYQLLTLRLPFDGRDVPHVLRAVLTQEPVRVRAVDSRIAPDLATICHKAIEKDPLRRYQRAAHMAADLLCWSEGRPILARPVGPTGRALRWTRRHRRPLLTAAAAAAISTTAGLATARHLMRRASMGTIAIPFSMSGATVEIRRFPPGAFAPGPARALGPAPLERRLDPGLYRLSFTFSDGSVREATSFVRAGGRDVIHVNPLRPDVLGCELIDVAPGEHRLGLQGYDQESLCVPRTIRLDAFRIGATETSVGAYRLYLRESNLPAPAWWSSDPGMPDDRLPIVGLSWEEANRFCRWAGVRLPTPDEWEAAARAPDARAFPWGNASRADLLKIDGGGSLAAYRAGALPVDSEPALRSPLGLWNTCSNVQEYVEGLDATQQGVLVKGRSYADDRSIGLAVTMTLMKPDIPSYNRGFRVAVSGTPVAPENKDADHR
jgi:formylglycine-generating enzyme required for sulfatase activity